MAKLKKLSERQKLINKLDEMNGIKKMKDKTKVSTLRNKLWPLCKRLTRKIYGNKCYTCGKENLSGADWQTGHYISRSVCGDYLYYDLRNLRPQDTRCNKYLSGATAIFREKLIERDGKDYVESLEYDRRRTVDARQHFRELIEIYTQKCEELDA